MKIHYKSTLLDRSYLQIVAKKQQIKVLNITLGKIPSYLFDLNMYNYNNLNPMFNGNFTCQIINIL